MSYRRKEMKNFYKERVIYIFLLVMLLTLPLKTRSVVAQTSEQDSSTEKQQPLYKIQIV